MRFPKDNRTILAAGAGVAFVTAVGLALLLGGGSDEEAPQAPPAAMGGLNIDLAEAPTLEPTRELRCFVDGQFVGMSTLADCARRNGLATDALDVGIDETGSLTAVPTGSFAPPPKLPGVKPIEPVAIAAEPSVEVSGPASLATLSQGTPCLRYTGSEWRAVGNGLTQTACVQALYAGYCVARPGDAQYGRWGDVTLRLVPRRVEQSNDNSRFRVLAEQDRNCQFPGL
jgi:hypothetical protein